MLKRFNQLLDFIGANKKIEAIKFIGLNVVIIGSTVAGVIFLKQIMIAFAGLMLLLLGNYFLISTYYSRKRMILADRESEFVTIIGYFQFFIANGYNVYQSLQSLVAYSSPWMEEQIQTLILEIDNDKSVKPFVNFANKFSNKVTNNVMLSIYQMVDEGENSIHMLQFNALFQQLSKSHQKELIDSKERSLGSLSSLPLIGAGAITVLLTFGIISMMGDMINVL